MSLLVNDALSRRRLEMYDCDRPVTRANCAPLTRRRTIATRISDEMARDKGPGGGCVPDGMFTTVTVR